MCPIGDTANGLVGAESNERTPQITQTAGLIQSQLKQLLYERAVIVKRIAKIRRAIAGLNAIYADARREDLADTVEALPSQSRSSLTEVCRSVLRNSTTPLTAIEMATLLRSKHGVDQKYLTRSITSICRRLVAHGEATVMVGDSGHQAWMCRTDSGGCPPYLQNRLDSTLCRTSDREPTSRDSKSA